MSKISNKYCQFVENSSQFQLIFRNKPFLSYKRNPNIKDHLIQSRFSTQGWRSPIERYYSVNTTRKGNNRLNYEVTTLTAH